MAKKIYTIKVDLLTFDKIKDHYQDYLISNDNKYITFSCQYNDVIINGYDSNKTYRKVTFEGTDAEIEAQKWGEILFKKENTTKKSGWICLKDQIGSDEVGVGDFLLPVIVVASFVKQSDISFLKEIGVDDSKKLSDIKIREIAPLLVKKIRFSKLTLPIEKYNEVVNSGENLNSIKAKMHNRALSNLHKEFKNVNNIFVDQFVNEDKYYEYLNDDNEEKVTNIVFKTKGESLYPSVAASSIIARYSFLLYKDELEKKYKMIFPFGAGKNADEFATRFIKKYGEDEFSRIAKHNFKNYKSATKER